MSAKLCTDGRRCLSRGCGKWGPCIRAAEVRSVTDLVRDVQRAQAALMSANSPRLAQVFRLRLRRLADELHTRTGGTLTAGPL